MSEKLKKAIEAATTNEVETTKENPIVNVYDAYGFMLGSINYSVAINIHGFKTDKQALKSLWAGRNIAVKGRSQLLQLELNAKATKTHMGRTQ